MSTKEKKSDNKPEFDYKNITGFKEACESENIDPDQLPGVDNIPEEFRKPLIAAYKLMVGTKAVNKGFKVDYTDSNQIKHFPVARVLPSGSGFAFALSASNFGHATAYVGSRLLSEDSDKTMHVFENFKEEYKDWLL